MKRKAAEGEDEKIHVVVTFDEHGVSYHPNHMACFEALKEIMCSHEIDFELYVLSTVSIFRKYISYIDIAICDTY